MGILIGTKNIESYLNERIRREYLFEFGIWDPPGLGGDWSYIW
jgi:hypothetical protein